MSPRLPQRPGPIRINWRFGNSFIQSTDRMPDIAHRRLIRKLAVFLEVNIHNMRDIRHFTVRNKLGGGENHLVWRQVLRDCGRKCVGPIALGPALQQVEIRTIVGKLDVHRRAELGLQQAQHVANTGYERCPPDQPFKGENGILRLEIRQWTDQWLDSVMANERD